MDLKPWHRGELCALDYETTGTDPFNDRIVTASIVHLNGTTGERRLKEWIINPGVDIPEAASRVHGVTNERARAEGMSPKDALTEINEEIRQAQDKGTPIIGFNLAYDLSMNHAEARRNGIEPPELSRVIDVAVLDKQVDKYRRGGRKLTDLCNLYGVDLGDSAHNSSYDALATARVGWRMAEKHPEALQIPLDELHEKQKTWRADQAHGLQTYFRRSKSDDTITVAPQWPVQLPEDDPDASRSPYLTPPEVSAPAPARVKIPEGRYAIENDDGTASFFVYDAPTEGPWAGRTFLKRQAGDVEYPVKGAEKAKIMAAIGKDPKAAAVRYGQLLGVCGMCNRTLTNPASIEAGIGPICASSF